MIYNLGSINIDHFYSVPRFPGAGETLAADEYAMGLGGKGANMSVAAARAGAKVAHIGAVGEDGGWTLDFLRENGVDVSQVEISRTPTGHAIINVDQTGENTIVLFPGANQAQNEKRVAETLLSASPGDILVLQNETNLQAFAAKTARDAELQVAYAAAPFSLEALQDVLPFIDMLFLNEVEMAQLLAESGQSLEGLNVKTLVVTKGAEGCVVYSQGADDLHLPAPEVDVVDTTGAGDTFTGYFLASIDQGFGIEEATRAAVSASALMVTRKGTAEAIPFASEVAEFPG